MATTSLKLPEELKTRIQSLASHHGFSSHAFMVSALERAVEQAEARRSFIEAAGASLEDVRNGGPVYAAEDVHQWVKARVAAHTTGEKVPEPTPIRGRGSKPAAKKVGRG
ncbi:hypothetical protein [Variovorax sp. dw_308]|uniref:hypothetical protein n=1 Tax=Variovorax sp. dw_308 TaxID=2721546 RepID=UPI001C43C1DD|nr:hypothetical protein [Variovorax sp. dw_308]